MENLEYDVIIFSAFVVIAFGVFVVTSIKEFSKMEQEDYTYDPNETSYGRNAIYNWLASLVVDKVPTPQEKKEIIKKAIEDMESEGIQFTEQTKEKLIEEIVEKQK